MNGHQGTTAGADRNEPDGTASGKAGGRSMTGAAGMARAGPTGTRRGLETAAPDPEPGNELPDLSGTAFRATDASLTADPDKRLKTAAAVTASKFIYRHESLF